MDTPDRVRELRDGYIIKYFVIIMLLIVLIVNMGVDILKELEKKLKDI